MSTIDFWNGQFVGDSGDWTDSANWTSEEPTTTNGDAAEILAGAPTIASSQSLEVDSVTLGGTADPTLHADGTLDVLGTFFLANGEIGGFGTITGTVDITQLAQGSPDADVPYSSHISGSIEVVAASLTVGGLLDNGLTIDAPAVLEATGASTINDGLLAGDGTLENGSTADSSAALSFIISTTDGGANNDDAIGTLENFGTVSFTSTPAAAGAVTLSAGAILNNGMMQFLAGATTLALSGSNGLSGSGELSLGDGTVVRLNGVVGNGQTIDFGPVAHATLQLGGIDSTLEADFHGLLADINVTDDIHFNTIPTANIAAIDLGTYDVSTFVTGTDLVVHFTDGTSLDLDLTGSWNPGLIVQADSDGTGGTDLNVVATPIDDWTGNAGDGQWTTGGNWSIAFNGGIPNSSTTVEITDATVTLGTGDAGDAATLELTAGADLIDQGNLFLQNNLEIVSGTTFDLDGGLLGFPSSTAGATVDAGGLFQGSGSYEDSLVDNGTVEALANGALSLLGSLSGTGTLQIDGGAILNASPVAGMAVVFNTSTAAPGTLFYAYEAGAFTGPTLDGIGLGDRIVIGSNGGSAPAYSIGNGTLTLSDGSGMAGTFDLNSPPAGLEFNVVETNRTLVATAVDNIPPVITVPATLVDDSGGTGAVSVAGVAVSDADPTFTTITVTLALSGPGTLSDGANSGALLTLQGSASALDTELGTLGYTPAATATGPSIATITVNASNNGTTTTSPNTAIPQSFDVLDDAADAASWTAVASGQWNQGTTWQSGTAPGSGGSSDDFIVGGSFDVGLDDAESARSLALVSADAKVNLDGTLTLAGTASLIALAGGTLTLSGTVDGDGGTVELDGGSLDVQFGLFDDIAAVGPLDVGGSLTIENGFSIAPLSGSGDGSITVSSPGGFLPELDFADAYTLRNADVALAGTEGYPAVLTGVALTLDATTSVSATGAQFGQGPFGTASTITNDGVITVTGTAQEEATSFTNAGAFIVNAGSLYVSSGTFDNAGSMLVSNASTLFLAGSSDLTGDGSITLEGGSTIEVATAVPGGAGFDFGDPATLILDDPATFNGTIGGLAAFDVLKLTGKAIESGSINGTTLTLDLVGGGTQTLNVAPGQSGVTFFANASGGLEVACFAAGTRILAARGAVPVEALREGDRVASAAGTVRTVRWIGRRHIDCRGHGGLTAAVLPVLVRAGAFAAGVPARDLRLSPDHAVFVDGVLVSVRLLVNGASIRQEPVETVTYYHVELPTHGVIFAEGLPTESYLDTGNRAAFEGGGARGPAFGIGGCDAHG